MKEIKEVIQKDAKEYGAALNSAAWEFIDQYRNTIGEQVSTELWNNCKSIIRPVIIKYLDEIFKNEMD